MKRFDAEMKRTSGVRMAGESRPSMRPAMNS
jgi:hypothetical protein